MNLQPSQREAAAEALRRRRARKSLCEFARAIDVPGRPISEQDDEWIFHPIETQIAAHHNLLMSTLERVHNRAIRQLMVFMPPGSAKSTYASVVYPSYGMGKRPGSRFILGSYASPIAWKQSRRTRQIVRSDKYRPLFGTGLVAGNTSVEEWALENGSEYMAGGILAGMTGNRASDLMIDDPVAGREEAESSTMRKKVREAYEDDLSTRLVPGGATVIIQTRWHEDDLSGGILPVDWSGESGLVLGRDGLEWYVLCLPAIAEHDDDPLGRKPGEALWPEWFKEGHFDRFKGNARTWSALFQQRPTPLSGDYFLAEWFDLRWERKPPGLRIFGCSDYAVTPDGGDYTEHGVFALDEVDNLYVIDWWYGQTASNVWIERLCDLIQRWQPLCWIGEAGPIRRAVEPYMVQRMTERNALTRVEWLPSIGDKESRARGIQALASMGKVRFPRGASWLDHVMQQLLKFPAAKHDDAVDVLGLAGRGLQLVGRPRPKSAVRASQVERYGVDDEMGI